MLPTSEVNGTPRRLDIEDAKAKERLAGSLAEA